MVTLSPRQASQLARRIAFRVLVAEITDKPAMDMLLRLYILEGAAGVRWGTWSRSNPVRGLEAARETFPEADPRWFLKRDTHFFNTLLKALRSQLKGFDESTVDDALLQLLGSTTEFGRLGNKYSQSITTGKAGYNDGLKGVAVIGKSRGHDYRTRNKHLTQEVGLPTDEEGNVRDVGEQSRPLPSSKELRMTDTDAMEDLILIDRRLMTVAKTVIKQMKEGTRKQVMEIWLDNPRLTNRDIASQLGVSGAYVGQTKSKIFRVIKNKASRYLDMLQSKYATAKRVAAIWLGDPPK